MVCPIILSWCSFKNHGNHGNHGNHVLRHSVQDIGSLKLKFGLKNIPCCQFNDF